MQFTLQHPADEVGRFLILMPEGTTFYSDSAYVPVVIERGVDGACRARLVCDELEFFAPYKVVGGIACDRAIHTVDGQLCVDGRRLTPEAYIRLWRDALAKPVPLDRLGDHGYALTGKVVAPWCDETANAKAPWTKSPFDSIAQVRERHPELRIGDGLVQLELPLRGGHDARDLWYFESMLSSALPLDKRRAVVGKLQLRALGEGGSPAPMSAGGCIADRFAEAA